MANERVVTTNFLNGIIDDAPLTNVATTLTSTGLANLPAIATGEYVVLVLDPDGVNGAPEVIYVTAHTGGATPATTATIVRGQEGTVARQHAQNVQWRNVPTKSTFGKSIDRPWGGDTTYDCEFDRDGSPTGLPSGWSWLNQGTCTYLEEFGAGTITFPAESTVNMRGIVRAFTPAAAFVLTAKIFYASSTTAWFFPNLVLRDSGAGKMVGISVDRSNDDQVVVANITNVTSPTYTGRTQTFTGSIRQLDVQYVRIEKISSTNYNFYYSPDGRAWFKISSAQDLSAFLTPDQFGVVAYNSNNLVNVMSIEWVRLR